MAVALSMPSPLRPCAFAKCSIACALGAGAASREQVPRPPDLEAGALGSATAAFVARAQEPQRELGVGLVDRESM